jgi:hypothetical protein
MWIKSGQQRGTRLAATGLRYECVLKPHTVFGEPVQHRGLHVRLAITAKFRPVAFGDDEQDVGVFRDTCARHCRKRNIRNDEERE